jgi:erythronate-4-phosphate dehydrogenase
VLDVWEQEPSIDRTLLEFVTLATPHIAGYSVDGKANGTAMSVQALSRHFNLGLDSWFPAHIPTPTQTVLKVECMGKKNEQILSELILATYDVRSDDRRLRASPETFEQQRGAYPLRREFPVYSVILDHATPETASLVKEIGFTLLH